MHKHPRPAYYQIVRRENCGEKILAQTTKIAGQISVCAGFLGFGGYFLYRRLKDLNNTVNRLNTNVSQLSQELQRERAMNAANRKGETEM